MLIHPEEILILSSYLEANQKFEGGEVTFDVNVQGELYEHRDDPTLYNAVLSLQLVSKNEKNPLPYKCKLKLAGQFRVSDKVAEKKKEEVVGVNGLSILYGSAREHILSITGRGPFPVIYLPCISFRSDSKEHEAQLMDSGTTKLKAAKTKKK